MFIPVSVVLCYTVRKNKAHTCSVTGSTHQETPDSAHADERGERRLQGMRSIDKTSGSLCNNACVADDKGLWLNVKRVK